MMIRTFLLLILLSIAAARCRTSLDCSDGLPETFDVCLPHRHCINVLPKGAVLNQISRQDVGEETSKEALLTETNAVPITTSERRKGLSVMSLFARDLNPHRFLHLNLLGYDPTAEFDALSSRVEQLSNVEFHDEVRDIFQRMNDRHTFYVRPSPLRESIALLNFTVAPFYVGNKLRYVATNVAPSNGSFETGVEIIRWNGVPIADEVTRLGEDGYGANKDAKKSQAITSLVFRRLISDEIPSEAAVSVTYSALNGKIDTVSIPWLYLRLPPVDIIPSDRQAQQHADPRPQVGYLPTFVRSLPDRTPIQIEEPTAADALHAEIVQTSVGPIGRLTVFSFPFSTPSLLAEYKRVISLLPSTGLIVDLRGNMGGAPVNVRNLLEFISDVEIPDFTTNVRATPLTQKIIFADERDVTDNEVLRSFYYDIFIKPLQPALTTTVAVGEMFTGPGANILTNQSIPRQERVYFGPFIVVIDGNTYSGGDLFSAFVADTEAAELVGVSNSTGAGGASILIYGALQRTLPKVLDELQVEFTTSYARVYRYGKNAGKLVERFGITPDILYLPTYRDAVEEDCDLFEFLAERLVGATESPIPHESPEELA